MCRKAVLFRQETAASPAKVSNKKKNGLFEFLMKKLNTCVGDRCCVVDRGDQTEAEKVPLP